MWSKSHGYKIWDLGDGDEGGKINKGFYEKVIKECSLLPVICMIHDEVH